MEEFNIKTSWSFSILTIPSVCLAFSWRDFSSFTEIVVHEDTTVSWWSSLLTAPLLGITPWAG